MKFLDEYRDEEIANRIVGEIRQTVTKPWVLTEVCGGQTHTIVKYEIDHLLPAEVELVHGPGCPVCVTVPETIDKAHHIAERRDGKQCTPERPLGATMVSAEGACAAYYAYGRHPQAAPAA